MSRERNPTPQFPFVDLKTQFESIRDQVTRAVLDTFETQRFILGPEVDAFEGEIAAWNCSAHAITCASGSDALLLALMALEIGPGDEVITTPFTFVATAGAIVMLGAKPVFVDIDPATFNIDPAKIEAALTNRTRAILPVHLYGLPADLGPICQIAAVHGIPVIEDAAQAIGANYRGKLVGNVGAIGCFSFYPAKNLGCAGDGGLLTTNNDALADKLRVLHMYGSRARYHYESGGINSRLDALQAAILRVKLPHLNAWTEGRRRNADRYRELFTNAQLESHLRLPKAPEQTSHVYNQFTIRCRDRDALRSHLVSRGMPCEIHYPSPLHLEPAFSYLGYVPEDLPESVRAAREVLSLPIYPELPAAHLEAVVSAIAQFYEQT